MGDPDRHGNSMNWIDALEEVTAAGVESVPKDFLTRSQIQQQSGMSPSTVDRKIAALLLMGKAERKVFRVTVADGAVKPVPHFRLLKK